MKKRYSIALVGCGAIAKKHIQAIADNKDIAYLKAVCDINLQSAQRIVDDYQDLVAQEEEIGLYDCFEALLAQGDVDIIAITTINGLHAQYAVKCLKHHKNVILEKPLALSTQDAERVCAAARASEGEITVCTQLRYAEPFLLLKELIANGQLGKIASIAVRVLRNRSEAYYTSAPWRGTWEKDGGTLLNQGIHSVDLLLWLMGEQVESIYANTATFIRPIETEDYALLNLRFQSGAIGLVEATVCVYEHTFEDSITIIAEKGFVALGGPLMQHVLRWEIEGVEAPERCDMGTHRELYRDFITRLEEGRQPMITVEEAKDALNVILGAHLSNSEKRPVLFTEIDEDIMNFKNEK